MTFLAVQSDTPGEQQFLLFSSQDKGWKLWAQTAQANPGWLAPHDLQDAQTVTPITVPTRTLPTELLRLHSTVDLVLCRFTAGQPVQWVLPQRVSTRILMRECQVSREDIALWLSRSAGGRPQWLVEPKLIQGCAFGFMLPVKKVFDEIDGLDSHVRKSNFERVQQALALLLGLLSGLEGSGNSHTLVEADLRLKHREGILHKLLIDFEKKRLVFPDAVADNRESGWIALDKVGLALHLGNGTKHREIAYKTTGVNWYFGYKDNDAALDIESFVRMVIAGGKK